MLQLSFEELSVDYMPARDRLEQAAHDVQRVMRIAYTRAFEKQRSPQMPEGIIRRELFDETNAAKVRQQARRISDHIIDKGSSYLLGWDNDELVGLTKTSPLRLHRRGLAKSNYYLNDVAVTYEGMGLGSALMLEALLQYPGEQRLSLDAYEGNHRANNWFKSLGFETLDTQPTGLELRIGQIVVPQFRMQSPYVGLVTERLAKRTS
ncbi:GNAT family N-acetyltransferase [Candidatus Saccharibacteria bacterium]|nr:GNAT family N-acetyltransferase [Candidatus Saccharibacteria bacterium]